MYNYIDTDTREKNAIWDFITQNEIATEEELQLVTCINGYSVDTLNDIIFARTAYRSMEQAAECEPDCYLLPDDYVEEHESEEEGEED